MPNLYEYLGIVIFIFSNDHDFHAEYNETGIKIDIRKNGTIEYKPWKGKKSLPPKKLKALEKFVIAKKEDMLQKAKEYYENAKKA